MQTVWSFTPFAHAGHKSRLSALKRRMVRADGSCMKRCESRMPTGLARAPQPRRAITHSCTLGERATRPSSRSAPPHRSSRTPQPAYPCGIRKMRPAGIEPAACGLKDRCSLAPRREPLTTELRAREGNDATTCGRLDMGSASTATPRARTEPAPRWWEQARRALLPMVRCRGLASAVRNRSGVDV